MEPLEPVASRTGFSAPIEEGRPPRQLMPGLWVFAPSRDSHGGTAWLLHPPGGAPLLIDCPGLTAANLAFLRGESDASPLRQDRRDTAEGGPSGLVVLTSREGHGRCRRLQQALEWPVLVQEQEAYLLPGVSPLRTFGEQEVVAEGLRLLWTPGPTPGSCVLHAAGEWAAAEGDVLFCGRLLVPTAPGQAAPLRTPRTFHWPRQLRSLKRLRQWLPAESPQWIASGAGLGALRGEKLIARGRTVLDQAQIHCR
jgi:hypothetical protein